MAPAAAMTATTRGGRQPIRYCGANKKQGEGTCTRGRGWGTDHPGYGNCKLHGGSTPSGIAAAAKEAALETVRADYAGEVELAPLDALLYTVRRGAQLVAYWQRAALTADDAEAFTLASANEAKALADLNRWAKAAVDAGVSQLQVEIAARTAERIVAAAEQALEALEAKLNLGRPLTAEERTAYAVALGEGLAVLETAATDL